MKNPFKVGDKVQYKDGDKRIFTVYQIYSDKMLSLNLFGYKDAEQDFQININEIKKYEKIHSKNRNR